MFKIVRDFTHRTKDAEGWREHSHRTIKKGLTLEEAQAHCKNPKTSMEGFPAGKDKYKGCYINWFDTYTET